MTADGVLPRRLAAVLPGRRAGRRTPALAILAVTVAVILMLVAGGHAELAEKTVFLLLFVFIAIQFAVLSSARPASGENVTTLRFVPVIGIVNRTSAAS